MSYYYLDYSDGHKPEQVPDVLLPHRMHKLLEDGFNLDFKGDPRRCYKHDEIDFDMGGMAHLWRLTRSFNCGHFDVGIVEEHWDVCLNLLFNAEARKFSDGTDYFVMTSWPGSLVYFAPEDRARVLGMLRELGNTMSRRNKIHMAGMDLFSAAWGKRRKEDK